MVNPIESGPKAAAAPLRVAVTADLAEIPQARQALRQFDVHPWISWEFVPSEDGELVLEGGDFDAAVVFAARVTERTVVPPLRLVARLGVGY